LKRSGGGGEDLPDQLSVRIWYERDTAVLEVRGELDLASYRSLEDAFGRALESRPMLVVLDLAELEFMDVVGLRSILHAQEDLAAAGKRLVLAAPAPGVKRLLALTGQEGALRISGSVAEALDANLC
jgi:anti-sigma B factor antagonist